MSVVRIVPNLTSADPAASAGFYRDVFGLTELMNLGWVVTAGASCQMTPQVSLASQGGSGTGVPALSIEVENLGDVLERLEGAGFTPEYGPVVEPWGVHRFYVRDPDGHLDQRARTSCGVNAGQAG